MVSFTIADKVRVIIKADDKGIWLDAESMVDDRIELALINSITFAEELMTVFTEKGEGRDFHFTKPEDYHFEIMVDGVPVMLPVKACVPVIHHVDLKVIEA